MTECRRAARSWNSAGRSRCCAMASLTSSRASSWRRECSRGEVCGTSGGETARSAITGSIQRKTTFKKCLRFRCRLCSGRRGCCWRGICRRLSSGRSRRFRLDGEQLNLEYKRGIRTDRGAGLARAVGQVRRNKELPLGSHRHQWQRFGPTLDDSAHWQTRGLAALVRAVEFRAVDERAAIVDRDGVSRRRLWPRALLENLVLQAAREGDNTIFDFVGGQKRVAFFLVGLGNLLNPFFLLLAQIGLQVGQNRLCFLVVHE